jgi:putative transposase
LWTYLPSDATIPLCRLCSSGFLHEHRIAHLKDPAVRSDTHAYLAGISKKLDSPTILVGGVGDHVHMLARLSRTISPSDWIKELKRASSLWIKERYPILKGFAWQSGYGVFSVSLSNVEKVTAYIAGQEEHHRQKSFQEEFRAMLKKHGVPWGEQYVWD